MKFAISLIAVIGVAQANFKSGSVATYEKFTYGKIKSSMKAPGRKGTVSSIYTFWDGPGFYPGGWNEIDLNVVPSIEESPVSVNAIYGDGHNKREEHSYADGIKSLNDEFSTYEIEWTPDYISYSVNGDVVRKLEKGDNEAVDFMSKEQSLRMNFWTPTFHAWGQGLNSSDMPWYLLFDYVEVYNWDKESGFDLAWRDDFNQFDQNRWHKISGSFEGSSSVFYPQNAYVSGGNLVLKMEPVDPHHKEAVHGLRHDHYDSDRHRLRREFDHLEHGSMIHDMLEPEDERHLPTLGSLAPRIHLDGHGIDTEHATAQTDKKGGESRHLTAQTFETRHAMHHELDHGYDDQHDVEPVHFHEHAVLKAVHEDPMMQDLSLAQKKQQHDHDKKKTEQQASVSGQKKEATVSGSFTISATTQQSQAQPSVYKSEQRSSQQSRSTQDQRQSRDQRGSQTQDQKTTSKTDTRSGDKSQTQPKKRIEEVMDMTPWEHHERRMHDVDAHFYTEGYGHGEHSRYGREYGQYGHGFDGEEEHGYWHEVEHIAPSVHDRSARPEPEHRQYQTQKPGHAQAQAPKIKPQHQKAEKPQEKAILAPKLKEMKIKADHPQHLQMHMHSHWDDHERLDHKFDDAHDVEPAHYHEMEVHPGFDHHDAHSFHHYEEEDHYHRVPEHREQQRRGARGYDTEGYPVQRAIQQPIRRAEEVVHESRHYEDEQLRRYEQESSLQHHIAQPHQEMRHHEHYEERQVHPELDHQFDDQKDIEPVHFHEHAIHRTFEDSHAYARDHGEHREEIHMPHHEYQEHHEHEMALPLLHDFLIQEPEYHHHEETFHGREHGYHYSEPVHSEHGHLDFESEDPIRQVEHGETFGKSHKAGDAEAIKRRRPQPKIHRDVYIEPLFVDEVDQHFERTQYRQPRQAEQTDYRQPRQAEHHGTQIQYEVDHEGHVHMVEDMLHYLQ